MRWFIFYDDYRNAIFIGLEVVEFIEIINVEEKNSRHFPSAPTLCLLCLASILLYLRVF